MLADAKTTQSLESVLPSSSTQPVTSSTSPAASPDLAGLSVADDDSPARREVEALRKQVVALQRISSLGVLAGGVFHELNNALTPIINYAKLGLRNPDPAYRDRALGRILEAGQRAATITGGMLALSRPGRDPDHRAAVDLNRLVEEVVLFTSKDLARNKVRLEVQLLGRPFARVNAAQIQQVLINLLINARQAMPDGGVVTLRLAPDPAGRLAELSVIDRGTGIAPEHLRRIFEPFFSTKSGPDASGAGGTGLGLAVCRDIVEAHHGRLRAESHQGQGSTFTLVLPTCPPPAEASARTGAA
jgi:signal transduction histidine kinase